MPDENSIPRYCGACRKVIKGRKDKKFCNDACRNSFNNSLKSNQGRLVHTINLILARNRRILHHLLPEGKNTMTTTKEKLTRLGFHFRYFTNTYTTAKDEKTYYYCYDYGYLQLENNCYLVVRKLKNN